MNEREIRSAYPHSSGHTIQLHPEPIDLNLIVRPPEMIQLPVLPPPAQIPRIEHHPAITSERIRLPPLRRLFRQVEIAGADADAAYPHAPYLADGNRARAGWISREHVDVGVGDWLTD